MSAAKKVATGAQVYYFTRCRTCVEIRRKLRDPVYDCVWCTAEKSNKRLHRPTTKSDPHGMSYIVVGLIGFGFVAILMYFLTRGG